MPASIRVGAILLALTLLVGACSAPPPPIFVVATSTPTQPPTATPRSVPTLTPGPTPNPYRDTIIIGLSRAPRTLHPLIADDDVTIHILHAVYEPYVTSIDFAYQANPNGGLMAELPTLENGAATLDDGGTPDDPADDQLTMIFNMLSGPTWCDGRPVTAADSVYAFNLARDPDSGAVTRAAIDRVESYTALDGDTIEVKLKPGQLDPAYSAYFWTPLPEHIWTKYTASQLQTAAEATRRLCGYGPYTIAGAADPTAGWIPGEHLTLAANPYYFRGAPRTPRLVFRFIQDPDQLLDQVVAGRLDVVTWDGLPATRLPEYAEYERSGQIGVAAMRSAVWEQLIFNLYAPTTFDATERARPHPILSDVRIRRAIAHAVDRQALIDQVYAGHSTVLSQPLTYPNHPLRASEDRISLYPFDPDRARALLDEAGWIDANGDGIRECRGCASGAAEGDRLTLTYRTTSSPLREPVVDRVQRDLSAVGFDIVVELLPREIFFGDATGLIVGDFDIAQLSELTDADPGGERRYGCEWIPVPGNGWYGENYSGWCNDIASRALLQAGDALQADVRRAAYATFQREVTRDLPGLPLFPRVDVTLVNPRLENFKPRDFVASVTWNAYELSVPNQ